MKTLTITVSLIILGTWSYAQVVDGGYFHTSILCNDSTIWTVGGNLRGQLGNNSTSELLVPNENDSLKEIVAIQSGGNHTFAINKEGKGYTWGYNKNGQLGFSSVDNDSVPKEVLELENIIDISAGEGYSLAVKNDGMVWGWGANNLGQLGDGTRINQLQPSLNSFLTGIKKVAAGQSHSLAIKNDGTVWGWGAASYGRLGLGTEVDSLVLSPIQIPGLEDVIEIETGSYHSMALKEDGSVWMWGFNEFGVLGNGTNNTSLSPSPVAGFNNIISISSGQSHAIALDEHGQVWTWGLNNYGQLGDGTPVDKNLPVLINLPGVVEIGAGIYHSMAVDSSGNVYAWGLNSSYQLGDSTNMNRYVPTQVKIPCTVQRIDPVCNTNAAFTHVEDSVCAGEIVDFGNESENATDFVWKIDQNDIATTSDLSHEFFQEGEQEVALIANPNGCSDTVAVTIHTFDYPEIEIIDPGVLCLEGDSVQLESNIMGGTWSGVGVDSGLFKPSIAGVGTHLVDYEVTNVRCTSTEQLSLIVEDKPNAGFVYTVNETDVQITNTSTGADSYEWVLGDGNVSFDENPTHQYENGVYNVILIATNDCGTSIWQEQVSIELSTDLLERKELTVNIFPNPAKGKINISANTRIGKVEVINTLGEIVFESLEEGSVVKLDVDDLRTGIYLLNLPDQGEKRQISIVN